MNSQKCGDIDDQVPIMMRKMTRRLTIKEIEHLGKEEGRQNDLGLQKKNSIFQADEQKWKKRFSIMDDPIILKKATIMRKDSISSKVIPLRRNSREANLGDKPSLERQQSMRKAQRLEFDMLL
jgi:hypothetical protein